MRLGAGVGWGGVGVYWALINPLGKTPTQHTRHNRYLYKLPQSLAVQLLRLDVRLPCPSSFMRILSIRDVVSKLDMFSIIQTEPGLLECVSDREGVFGHGLHHGFAGVFGVLPGRGWGCGECTEGSDGGCPVARAEEGQEGGHCEYLPRRNWGSSEVVPVMLVMLFGGGC